MTDKDLAEFKSSNMPCNRGKGKRKIIVTHSWGVYDAYKHIRKNGWYDIGRPLTEHEFYSIVRKVGRLLTAELIKGNKIKFPCLMGSLELRKYSCGVSIVGGKLKNTYPIDWEGTWKLWFDDKEAFKNKTLLRMEESHIYHVKYLKWEAKYENKIFYLFKVPQKTKKQLKESIKKGVTDTLWE